MIIDYELDCWKCSEYHAGQAATEQEFWAVVTGGGDWQHAVRVLKREPRRLRIRRDGKLWLIPWFGNRGILIGASGGPVEILPWITARWEFADHDGGTYEWKREVLGGRRV